MGLTEKLKEEIKLYIVKKYNFSLNNSLMEQLLYHSEIKEFAKGELILNYGDTNKFVYMMIHGSARSFYLTEDGKDMTRYFIQQGDFCAEESMMGKVLSSYSIEALESGCLLKIPALQLKSFLMGQDQFKDLYIAVLEEALLYKMGREYSFMVKDARERYVEFCDEYGELEAKISQKHIASYLGITPETLSRIRREMKKVT